MKWPTPLEFEEYLTVRGLKLSSVRHCLSRYGILLSWIGSKSLTEKSCSSFIFFLKTEKKLTNNSINTYIFMLRMLEECMGCHFLGKLKSQPKDLAPIDPLTPEEIELILDSRIEYGLFHGRSCNRLNLVYSTMTRAIALTGCRYDECAKLTWQDVDLIDGWLTFKHTKNRDWRRIHITEPLVGQLKSIKKADGQEGYVFSTMTGGKIAATTYSQDLRKRAKQVGITKRVHPHIFRHSFASEIYRRTKDIRLVQTLLGHKDIQSTERYTKLDSEYIKEGVYYHSLVWNYLPANKLLGMFLRLISPFQKRFSSDNRFSYRFSETEKGFDLSLRLHKRYFN